MTPREVAEWCAKICESLDNRSPMSTWQCAYEIRRRAVELDTTTQESADSAARTAPGESPASVVPELNAADRAEERPVSQDTLTEQRPEPVSAATAIPEEPKRYLLREGRGYEGGLRLEEGTAGKLVGYDDYEILQAFALAERARADSLALENDGNVHWACVECDRAENAEADAKEQRERAERIAALLREAQHLLNHTRCITDDALKCPACSLEARIERELEGGK